MSASKDAMEALHTLVAAELTRRITDGEATAADIGAAIKFLKDNGIESQGAKNPAVQTLADTLPDLSAMEDEFTPTTAH